METIQAAVDKALPPGRFNIYSGILKASRSADGKMRLHGVASSTTRDLHGDTMQPTALEAMERAANGNLTIFLNHSYEVPEDVAGSVERAVMKTRGVDGDGNPNYDLDMDILVNDSNPRAVKAFEAIERGTKLGLSIGALIPDGGARKEKNAYLIDNVELLETSLVGIPANPRSWIEYAAKSLRGAERVEEAIVASAEPEIVDAASCPYCEDGDPCSKHKKDVEPDITDAAVDVHVTIETEDGSSVSEPASPDVSTSQEAVSSNPGNEGDVAASVDDELVVQDQEELTVASLLPKLTEQLRTTVSELVETKQALVAMTTERDAAIGERDTAVSQRDTVLAETQRVLNRLADTPLMRRAVVIEADRELRNKFSSIYSEDFLKMLEIKP